MTRLSFALSDENAAAELSASPQRTRIVHTFDIGNEAQQLFRIALPTVLIQFSLFLTFPMAASSVGRSVGTTALAAFSLGGLLGNLTCLSILEGALTAADTLMPRSYGVGKYEEVGMLAVRGTIVCVALLAIPVIPLCRYARYLLVLLGQDAKAAELAQTWIQIYFLGVPPNIYFRVTLRFLLAQNQPWPLVITSAVPCFLIHPFLLRYWVDRHGLEGSAIAIVFTQWITGVFLFLYVRILRPHKAGTWSWKLRFFRQSMRLKPLLEFFHLSIGGIFTMIEWWFFETMVCIHQTNIFTQKTYLVFHCRNVRGCTLVCSYDSLQSRSVGFYASSWYSHWSDSSYGSSDRRVSWSCQKVGSLLYGGNRVAWTDRRCFPLYLSVFDNNLIYQ